MIANNKKGYYIIYEDGKKEYVKLGLITDYYIEIFSEALSENKIIVMQFNN